MTSASPFEFTAFRHEINAYQRRLIWPVVLMLSMVLISLAGFAWATWYFDLPHDPPGELTWKRSLALFGLLLGTLGPVFSIAWFADSRRLKYLCPHCQKELGLSIAPRLVLATGHCPHCLQPLFTANESESLRGAIGPHLLTRAEFQEQRSQFKWPTPLIPLIVFFAGGILFQAINQSYLKPRLDEFQSLISQIVILSGLGVLVIGILLVRSLCFQKHLAKIRCGECGTTIASGPIPLVTGNCHQCGALLFSDPPARPPWPVCEMPISISEIRSRGTIWRRWGWLCCLAGSVPTILLLVFYVTVLAPGDLRRPIQSPLEVVGFVMIAISQPIGIAICQWVIRQISRVSCPSCRHTLVDVPDLVVASRNCPYCATTIVSKEAAAASHC